MSILRYGKVVSPVNLDGQVPGERLSSQKLLCVDGRVDRDGILNVRLWRQWHLERIWISILEGLIWRFRIMIMNLLNLRHIIIVSNGSTISCIRDICPSRDRK